MSVQKQTLTLGGFVITFLGAILFSTKAIFVKLAFAATSVDAVTLLALRMLFSLPFYLGVAFFINRRSGNVKLTARQWILTIIIGLLGYYISSLFDFLGLQYISAGLERLILFLYPSFAVLINGIVYKQKISLPQRLSLLLTYAGIAIAYVGELQYQTYDHNFILGSVLVFLCAVTYSFYIVGSGRIVPVVGATKFTAYAMLAATAGIFIHYLLATGPVVLSMGQNLWLYAILLALLATVIPSFLLSYGMKIIGSNNVAIISSVGPVSTILQAHFFLGEPMFAAQLFGTALVIAGILLLSWRKHAPETKE
jgi:drug/metabolite transporter (DMT)-like permease